MSQLVTAVLSHADHHTELTAIISEREYATPALVHQTAHVRDLRKNLADMDKLLETMAQATLHEKKQFESSRDSAATRLSYALTGRNEKYRSKTEHEEKGYEEAVKKEYVARVRREELFKEVEEAERLEGELKVAVTELAEAKSELERIYSDVFHGFTAEFPDDDTLEEVAHTNVTTHEETQTELSTETEAQKLLLEASKEVANSFMPMSKAIDTARGAKHGKLEAHEANPKLKTRLDLVHKHVDRALNLVNQAREWSAKISDVGPLRITDRRTVPSSYVELRSFHHKLQAQSQELWNSKTALLKEIAASAKRISKMNRELPVL